MLFLYHQVYQSSGCQDYQNIPQHFTKQHGGGDHPDVASQEPEGNGYNTAYNGQKGKESHKRAPAVQVGLHTFHFLTFHMEVFLQPIHASEPSHPITGEAAQ